MDERRAAILLLASALMGGCYTVAAAGIEDCKARGCAWNPGKARCECSTLRPGGRLLDRVPGKLEGQ